MWPGPGGKYVPQGVQSKSCVVEGLVWSLKILSWDRIMTESSKAPSARVKSQSFIKWKAGVVLCCSEQCFGGTNLMVFGVNLWWGRSWRLGDFSESALLFCALEKVNWSTGSTPLLGAHGLVMITASLFFLHICTPEVLSYPRVSQGPGSGLCHPFRQWCVSKWPILPSCLPALLCPVQSLNQIITFSLLSPTSFSGAAPGWVLFGPNFCSNTGREFSFSTFETKALSSTSKGKKNTPSLTCSSWGVVLGRFKQIF